MDTITLKSLLNIVAFILFIFKIQFAFASMNDEDTINKIFEAHGKENVVRFISQRRGRNITIQKNKSFLSIKGRPDITLITAKSIIQDLNILNIDISDLESELVIYMENQSKKQQEENNKLNNSAPIIKLKRNILSNKLMHQIQTTQSRYDESTNNSERRRLKKELSILRKAYKQAKNNEKSKFRVYVPDEKAKKNKKHKKHKSLRKFKDRTKKSD